MVAELLLLDFQDDGKGIDLEGGELVEAEGEIEIGLRVVGGPAAATAVGVAQACEGEDVLGELGGDFLQRGVVAVVTPACELARVLREADFPAPVVQSDGGCGLLGR